MKVWTVIEKPNGENIYKYTEDSKLLVLQKDQDYSSLNSIIDISAIIRSNELIKNNRLICSFECFNNKYKFEFPLNFSIENDEYKIKISDMLHKTIFNKYINLNRSDIDSQIIEHLSLKYQFLTSYTSLLCLVCENNMSLKLLNNPL